MSFVKDMLFGEEGTPATVQDVRTDAGRAVGDQALGILSQILGGGGNLTTAPAGGMTPEMQRMQAIFGGGGGGAMGNAVREMLGRIPGTPGQGGGTTGGVDASGFTARAGGPMVAPLSEQENQILAQLQGLLTGPNATAAGQERLTSLASGGGMSDLAGLTPQVADLARSILSGETMDPASNPALAASIEAAQRPLIEQFGDQMGSMRGAFTQAGQFVQPGSSSPFETAQGRLQTGLANAMGDVSTRLVADNMNQERARQTQVLDTIQQAFESGQNRSANAAVQTAPFTSSQLQSMMAGLEASALPRLVEQAGIQEGTRQFERQQNQLLDALTMAFTGVGTPQTVTVPGTEGSSGLVGSIMPAIGTAIGGPVGGALGKGITNLFG